MKGKTVKLAAGEEPRQAEVVDLMERLRRSLEQAGSGKAAKGAHTPRKKGQAKRRARHAA
jgi:non-homologous end joining protein Ku